MKKLVEILEQLAHTPSYRMEINELIKEQSAEMKQAFLTQDGSKIKNLFGDSVFADRDKVVQIVQQL